MFYRETISAVLQGGNSLYSTGRLSILSYKEAIPYVLQGDD